MKNKDFYVYPDSRKLPSTFFFVFIFSAVLLAGTASAAIPDTALLDNFLKKTVKSYRIPGLAAALVNSEGTIWMSGYGKSGLGGRITPGTPFYLGSTSKSFTALAVMRLAETGKVELDSSVKKYLPEFRLASAEYENSITVRHLINHTSGLSEEGMPRESFGENSFDDELAVLRLCRIISTPGTRYEYFNANYSLLGLIIERVSGLEFGEFLDSEIFSPLRMESTFAGPEGVADLAKGHGEFFGFPIKRKQKYRAGALPSGYLVSSVSDIALFLTAELRAGRGDTGVFNPGIIKATWQPPAGIQGGYAMGWMVFDDRGKTPFIGHGGSLENYQSFFYINPETDLGFVFLMNQGGILPIYRGFAALRNGLIRIMDNEQPEDGPGSWSVLLVVLIFLLVVALEAYLTFRLKNWKARMQQKSRWNLWTGTLLDFLISCTLLFVFRRSWYILYGLLPEFFILLLIIIIAGLVRSFVKTGIIIESAQP